jgi:PPK2 family polyphosphate:nucleotide phosphotransferase
MRLELAKRRHRREILSAMKFRELKRFRIEKAHGFRLADFDPADTCGMDIGKSAAKDMIADGLRHLAAMQEKLYAQNSWALLIVLQGMDASGKDGVVKHVMSGLNPQGCEVHAFKAPTAEELEHDFLWRVGKHLPARGRFGIFNRSHYEDVLVVRVKRELLGRQHLPPELVTKAIWSERFKSIRAFERHLTLNGTMVLKFHLRISREEQRRRLLARLDEPDKRWKFSMDDVNDSKLWGRYMDAYEDAIRNTATAKAPWYVVPADHKWFAWLMVAAVIADAMERLDLQFPRVTGKALAELEKVRQALTAAK